MRPEDRVYTATKGCGERLELPIAPGDREMETVREEGSAVVVDVDHPAVDVLGVAGSNLLGSRIVGVVASDLDRNPTVVFRVDLQRWFANTSEGLVILVSLQIAHPEILVGVGNDARFRYIRLVRRFTGPWTDSTGHAVVASCCRPFSR